MMESTDHQGLLASDAEDDVPRRNNKEKSRIRMPKGKIVVEPVLFFFALLNFPFISLVSQYTLRLFSDELRGGNSTGQLNHSACEHMNHSSKAYILEKEVQSHAAYFQLMLNIMRSVPALFMSLLLGSYSDQKGRKVILYISLTGLSLNISSYVLVSALSLPKWVLFFGAFAEGICGSMMGVILGCLSYVADITTHENRAFRITVAELCIFFPIIVSSLGLGVLIKKLGFMWPFVIVLSGAILNIIYIIFFVPETVIPNPEAKFLDFSHIKKSAQIFTKDNGTGRRPKLQVILLATFFAMIATMSSFSLNVLYVSDMPLCWDSVLIGIYGAVFMFVATVGGGICARLLKICLSDVWIAVVSGVLSFMGSIYVAFVDTTLMMFLACLFSILFEVFVPTLRAIASKHVEPWENGAVFSGISAVEICASLAGTAIFNPIYSKTNTFMHGFVYLMISVCQFISILFVLLYIYKYASSKRELSVKCEEDTEDIPRRPPVHVQSIYDPDN